VSKDREETRLRIEMTMDTCLPSRKIVVLQTSLEQYQVKREKGGPEWEDLPQNETTVTRSDENLQ